MRSPSVDIIVPVWNNLFETRDCLAALRMHSPEARLIVVDNGSNRETELMLEEFSEPLDENALFLKSERNIGLIKAVNMGLALSDSDFAVIIRPHVLVTSNWLVELIDSAKFGISSPVYLGNNPADVPRPEKGISRMETCGVSLSALVLNKAMRDEIGVFDEDLDGGEWCIADYVKRAASYGYKVFVCSTSVVSAGQSTVFGSDERLAEIDRASRTVYLERWGAKKHFSVYFGRIVETETLKVCMETILKAARLGHRFTILLHEKQKTVFLRSGWNYLHTSIELRKLSLFFSIRDLKRQLLKLNSQFPTIVTVEGKYGALKNMADKTLSFDEIAALLPK